MVRKKDKLWINQPMIFLHRIADLTMLRKGDQVVVAQRAYGKNIRYRYCVLSNGPCRLEMIRQGWEHSRRMSHHTWDYHLYREFAPISGKPVEDY